MNSSSPQSADVRAQRRLLAAQQGYALWAATYDEEANPLLALEERTLEPLLPDLKGKSALDVACGTGRWLEILKRRGATSVAGVDFCAPMLERAAEKLGMRGRLVCADCEELPFRPDSSDLAVLSFALAYLPKLESLTSGLARIVRQRGQVFISDLHPSACERGWHRSFRSGNDIVEISSWCYSIEQVCREFRRHGLALVNVTEAEFGEPEREIFAFRGKAHLFDTVSGKPAIWVGRFEKSPRT